MNGPSNPGLGRASALALLLLMGGLWGLQFAMLKLAGQAGYSELNILMLALVLLSAVFASLLVARGETFTLNRGRLVFLGVTAVLGYIAPLLAALHAAPHIPAGVLTLIASLTPMLTISVALIFKTERVAIKRILAVAFGALAVVLVLAPELRLPGYGAAYWLVIALIVPFCYGVESIYIAARWPAGMTALQAVAGETWIAAILVLPVFLVFGDPVSLSFSVSSAEVAVAVFVLAGVIESLVYFYLIRTTGGVFVSFGTFVSLFAGIGWGVLLFSESHGVAVWGAVIALCVSIGLVCLDQPQAVKVNPGRRSAL